MLVSLQYFNLNHVYFTFPIYIYTAYDGKEIYYSIYRKQDLSLVRAYIQYIDDSSVNSSGWIAFYSIEIRNINRGIQRVNHSLYIAANILFY